jgi:hypothetical protein
MKQDKFMFKEVKNRREQREKDELHNNSKRNIVKLFYKLEGGS